MKFSERLGYKPVRKQLQVESIDDELKNSLWSIFLDSFLNKLHKFGNEDVVLHNYHLHLWFSFFKLPIDTTYISSDGYIDKIRLIAHLRNFFFESKNWYDPYDLIEFTAKHADNQFVNEINSVLEIEKSGYRFVNRHITPITSAIEIAEIEDAISQDGNCDPVSTHLNAALSHLADKHNPNYRNSIKESISAVESMSKILSGNEKATLGETLLLLEKSEKLHPALKKAFSSLYGYTSDDAGIRHALIEGDRKVDLHEAKFMLVTCSSFINFLKSKL